MLGFLYLILILGWMLIVIFLRCKKSIAPHLAANNYPENIDRNTSVHVIQLQPDDYSDTSGYHQNNHHHHHHQQQHHLRSIIDDRLENSYPIDAVINPAYTNDEEFMINAPPPSYDEVMRQPDVYPKVQEIIKSNSNTNK